MYRTFHTADYCTSFGRSVKYHLVMPLSRVLDCLFLCMHVCYFKVWLISECFFTWLMDLIRSCLLNLLYNLFSSLTYSRVVCFNFISKLFLKLLIHSHSSVLHCAILSSYYFLWRFLHFFFMFLFSLLISFLRSFCICKWPSKLFSKYLWFEGPLICYVIHGLFELTLQCFVGIQQSTQCTTLSVSLLRLVACSEKTFQSVHS